MILYLETNFLMAVATGRESHAQELLQAVPPLVLAIPTISVMEAFSALEDDLQSRKRFEEQLKQQISQLRRDNTSFHASALLTSLQQAKIQNTGLLNDVQERMFRLMRTLSSQALWIDTSPHALAASIHNELVEGEPTDNLILHTLLDHSARNEHEPKAFLSENTRSFEESAEVKEALGAQGIKFFSRSRSFLEWSRHRPSDA